MRRLAFVVALATTLPAGAASAAAAPIGKEAKAEGYLEYRVGRALIVDGQTVLTDRSTKVKLKDEARDVGSIPLGYELKARGVRKADGSILASELEARKNGSALFEKDVKRLTDDAESEYRRAGRYYNQTGGRTETVGWMSDEGARVERARRIAHSLVPPYIDPADLRVYVIENREWNAFAMGNYSIYVFSGLLDDLDDDELAIVLGHELAHATHEHTRRQFKKAMWVQLAALGLAVAAEDIDDRTARAVAQLLIVFSATAWQNGYGRDLEDQADRVGLRYAYEAGYDISKGPRLWERFARRYGEPGKAANFFFGNHSLASQRAVNLDKQIALNYPDGPKDTGVRMAVAGKAPASGRSEGAQGGSSPAQAVPQGAAALAGSGGASGPGTEIRPGLTAAEVAALLGKAKEEVAFGTWTAWTYPAFTVVFENGRVVEVRF